jgi:hypothetical protein
VAASLSVLAAWAGGCNQDDKPVLELRGRGASDVYFVMRQGQLYHVSKKCELTLDEENILCDEHGRQISTAPIMVPGDADKLMVRPDGMVLVWCEDGWVGIGQLTLLRLRSLEGEKAAPKPCKRLWEIGIQMVPSQPDCPKVKPLEWVLHQPARQPWDTEPITLDEKDRGRPRK